MRETPKLNEATQNLLGSLSIQNENSTFVTTEHNKGADIFNPEVLASAAKNNPNALARILKLASNPLSEENLNGIAQALVLCIQRNLPDAFKKLLTFIEEKESLLDPKIIETLFKSRIPKSRWDLVSQLISVTDDIRDGLKAIWLQACKTSPEIALSMIGHAKFKLPTIDASMIAKSSLGDSTDIPKFLINKLNETAPNQERRKKILREALNSIINIEGNSNLINLFLEYVDPLAGQPHDSPLFTALSGENEVATKLMLNKLNTANPLTIGQAILKALEMGNYTSLSTLVSLAKNEAKTNTSLRQILSDDKAKLNGLNTFQILKNQLKKGMKEELKSTLTSFINDLLFLGAKPLSASLNEETPFHYFSTACPEFFEAIISSEHFNLPTQVKREDLEILLIACATSNSETDLNPVVKNSLKGLHPYILELISIALISLNIQITGINKESPYFQSLVDFCMSVRNANITGQPHESSPIVIEIAQKKPNTNYINWLLDKKPILIQTFLFYLKLFGVLGEEEGNHFSFVLSHQNYLQFSPSDQELETYKSTFSLVNLCKILQQPHGELFLKKNYILVIKIILSSSNLWKDEREALTNLIKNKPEILNVLFEAIRKTLPHLNQKQQATLGAALTETQNQPQVGQAASALSIFFSAEHMAPNNPSTNNNRNRAISNASNPGAGIVALFSRPQPAQQPGANPLLAQLVELVKQYQQISGSGAIIPSSNNS